MKKIKSKSVFAALMFSVLLLTSLCSCDHGGENESTTTEGETEMTETTETTETTGNETKEDLPVTETKFNYEIDFSKRDYSRTPYLKKFDMFTATWGWSNDLTHSDKMDNNNLNRIKDIAELLPETMRTDLFMGHYGIGRNIGSSADKNGTSDAEFAMIKALTDKLAESNLDAEFIYFASPVYTGGGLENDKWKKVTDLDKWNELCFNIASYFKANGMNIARHEIWNEPDYYVTNPKTDGVYFLGSWQDYIDLYISGAKGVRAADPDALIGGVSAAWMNKISQNGEFDSFLSQSLKAEILPDYVSWHFYGSNGGMKMLEDYISGARKCLENSDDYDCVQQHLNEFNISLDTDVTNSYSMVRSILSTYDRLLEATDITRVTWATALDRSLPNKPLALINPKNSARVPAYYTMWLYARLPIAPVTVTGSKTSKVEVMASVGDTRAALIAYDTGLETSSATFTLDGIPFDLSDITVYVIDPENKQTKISSNSPKLLAQYNDVDTSASGIKYSVDIPKDGAVYVQIDKKDAEADSHERVSPLSDNVVRTDYWYNGRDEKGAYAWFGSNSLMASIGSGSSKKSAGTEVAVTLDGMKNKVLSFDTVVSDGIKKLSENSMFGITVAYDVGGKYTKTVYYALNGVDGNALIPLGTERRADETVSLGSGSGTYEIDLNFKAPENWDGRIQLGFVVNDIPTGCGAEFIINEK